MRGLCLCGWRDRPTRGWRGEGCLSSHTMVDGYRTRRRKRSRGVAQLWGKVAAQMSLHHPVVPIASSCIAECVRAPGAYGVTETETRAGRQNVLTAHVGVYTPSPPPHLRRRGAVGGPRCPQSAVTTPRSWGARARPRMARARRVSTATLEESPATVRHTAAGTPTWAQRRPHRRWILSSCPLADGFPPSAFPDPQNGDPLRGVSIANPCGVICETVEG